MVMVKFFKRNKNKVEYQFLSDTDEIIQSPGSLIGSIVIWILFITLAILLSFSFFGKVDIVSTSKGAVIPDGNIKVVQSVEEGTVTEQFVKEGDVVKEGQILLKLDNGMKKMEHKTNQILLKKAEIEKKVLEAVKNKLTLNDALTQDELLENPSVASYYENIKETIKVKEETNVNQKTQHRLEVEIAKEEIEKISKEIKQKEQELNVFKDKKEETYLLEEQLKTIVLNLNYAIAAENEMQQQAHGKKELEKNLIEMKHQRELFQNEYNLKIKQIEVSKNEHQIQQVNLNNGITNLKRELNQKEIHMKKIEDQFKEIDNQKKSGEVDFNQELLVKILEKEEELIQLKVQVQKGEKSLQYNEIKAPSSGKIYGLQINTVGEVIQPATTIMTIVPKEADLIVETNVLNRDIGFIKENQEVRVKVDTFSFQKYGTLIGKVEKISAHTVKTKEKQDSYKVKIRLNHNQLIFENKTYPISSGMEVTSEIKIGKRRIIEFFLEPLVKYLDEGLKIK